MPDLRPILFIIGLLLLGVAASMLLPAVVDLHHGDGEWDAFILSAAVTAAVGGAMTLGFRLPAAPALAPRDGFLLTVLAWLAIGLFATLPLMLSARQLSFTDAFFEAMSGLTTTGATVLTGLDNTPRGILLWRALLHLFGGVGIIVMAVTILPVLRVGGMQLFRAESSDRSDKIRPRVSQVALTVVSVYAALALGTTAAFAAAGMPLFDAVCHAISAVSTGGFSTKDLSIGFYRNPAIEWIGALAMLLGGCSFALLWRVGRNGELRAFLQDSQTRWFLGYLAIVIAAVALWQVALNDRPALPAIRATVFNVISIATTTGYASEDYLLWGPLPIATIMVLYFIGGCTGSTSGGIKVFRFCVLGSVAHWQIRHLVHPHRIQPPSYNGKPISAEVVHSVLSFFFFYMASFAALSIGVSAFGPDLVTSMSAVAQALGNVGPGLSPEIGPVGSYAPLDDGAKWLLSAAMLLGRLELLTILVLFSPTFWRG